MGKVLSEIGDREASFIAKQKVFFVATAPNSNDHHVSVSPKANNNQEENGSCLVVLDPHTVAYADLTGSGAETAAHVLQNGRMTIMISNLEAGPPKILRLFGKAEVILAEHVPKSLLTKFPSSITTSFGFRAVYKLRVTRISSSCGYSLPVMDFVKYRSTLDEVTLKEGTEGIFNYQTKNNSFSIDGLPSLALLRKDAPANISPVAEDGYIYGKPTAKSGPANHAGATDVVFKLQQKQQRDRVSLRKLDLIMAGVLVFVVGFVTSSYLGQ